MINERIFSVIVKPNSKENKVIDFDRKRNAYIISIKAPAQNNKANIELIKFLSRITGKRVRIKSGLKAKTKCVIAE